MLGKCVKKIVGRDEELEPLEIRLKRESWWETSIVAQLIICVPLFNIMISYLILILICSYKSLS